MVEDAAPYDLHIRSASPPGNLQDYNPMAVVVGGELDLFLAVTSDRSAPVFWCCVHVYID